MTRRIRTLAVICALGAATCGERPSQIDPADAAILVDAAPTQIELGQGFALRVVRSWRKPHTPEPFDVAMLSPLAVQLDTSARRENVSHVEETLRYRAYAFEAGELRVPEVALAAASPDGGEPLAAVSDAFSLRVLPALPRGAAQEPELPGGPLREELPWLPGIAGVIVGTALIVWQRRRALTPPPPPPAEPAEALPPPDAVARGRLDAARAQADDLQAICRVAAATLRDYVGERFGVDAPEKTTEELLRLPELDDALEPDHTRLLGSILVRCDLVKFGRHLLARSERTQLIDDAARFVDETRAAPALPPPVERETAPEPGA